MSSDRFTYKKGDIQIKKSQCDFCKHNCKDEAGKSQLVCLKYPDGKPDEIAKTLKKCPFLEY